MTTSIREALVAKGLATTIQAPEPVRTNPDALPKECVGLPIHDKTYFDLVILLTIEQVARVYLKTGKREVRRIMDAFTVNEGRVVEMRLQGDEDFRSFDATETARVIVVLKPETVAKTTGGESRAQREARKAKNRAERLAAQPKRGSNPAAAKYGTGSKKK